jgi:glycosyltransferase involved in cell wall biosynthesis
MEVHQFATSLSYGDAISNEMMEIRQALKEEGYCSEIFVKLFDPRMAKHIKDYREYKKFSSSQNVVIFHFSIGSPVSKVFFRIPDKKIMIYHNITPYEYFLDYHRILTRECYKGRLEINLFVDKVDLALGDSEFNRKELERVGYRNTSVLPLLLDFAKFDSPGDPVVKKLFSDNKFTLLFVGRVIPNKKFEDVIKIFYFYKKYYSPDSRLILAGDYRGMEQYLAGLQDLVQKLELEDVYFTGHISFPELVAYFNTADVYLSMSAHEGFGVPLLEAFYKKIPVVAFAAGAVEETMNSGGVLIRQKNFAAAAALLNELHQDRELREKVVMSQNKALKKYGRSNVYRILLSHVREVGKR